MEASKSPFTNFRVSIPVQAGMKKMKMAMKRDALVPNWLGPVDTITRTMMVEIMKLKMRKINLLMLSAFVRSMAL